LPGTNTLTYLDPSSVTNEKKYNNIETVTVIKLSFRS
jgi:hypothetical protein